MIGHPVFRSELDRRDDGRTALCLGLIRPYKGTEDAVEAVLGVDGARLLVVGDPRDPTRRPAAHGGRAGGVAARLPPRPGARQRALRGDGRALPVPRGDRPLGRAPAGARGRRAGDRLRHRRPRRGRRPLRRRAVVPPGDVEAMSAALARLLGDADALAAARTGAERAREELTWDASAAAHSSCTGRSRDLPPGRFRDLVERQLDLFERRDATLLDEAAEADAPGRARARRVGGAATATTSSSSMRSERAPDIARRMRRRWTTDRRGLSRDFGRAARRRFGRLAAFLDEDD